MTAVTSFATNDLVDELTLDALSDMASEQLDALYRQGQLPESMARLDGKPKGRMLAVRGLDTTPLSFPLRLLASSRLFPWAGKSFRSATDKTGEGINRINLTLSQRTWFPFNTVIEPSVIDGKPCIYLDYDLAGNPWFVRRIRDELREVAPGLFLGPAMWKQKDAGAMLVLWFAIDTRA